MEARLARLLLVVAAALALCACARADDVLALREWTLLTPDGSRKPVTLPAPFAQSDLDAQSHSVLETDVQLPSAQPDEPVTLAVFQCPADATLWVDGVRLPVDRTGILCSWHIARTSREARSCHVRLDLDLSTGIAPPAAPRLGVTSNGDALFGGAGAFDLFSSVAALAISAFVSLLYATLFAFDRRHAEYGWFSLQVALALPVGSIDSGLLFVLGPRSIVIATYSAVGAIIVGACFMRSYFGRAPLHRAWLVGLLLVGVVCVSFGTISGTLAISRLLAAASLGLLVWQVTANLREAARGVDRFGAAAFATAWIVLGSLSMANVGALMGAPEIVGGFRFVAIGQVAFVMCQALVLARDHIRSLREAEARVTQLEAQRREVDGLNEELRRQVAERSRELTEALARSEGSVAPAALEVGDVFDGRYRVARALGRGGMGAVYEVERTRDGRKLALKVVTAALQAKQAARFAREAEIGSRLRHENLVSIVDVGIAAGATPFLVMELVQGGSLEDKRARFGDAAWARPIVRQIAAGLAELHANRIVHRDLKPGNVLLVENGGASPPVAKISDFGISRFGALDDSADVDAEGATAHPGAAHASPRDLTETGALMGTPVYMPPEAWFGPARHPSADVFSLGVLAYETLTGRSPFAVPPVLLVRSRQPIPRPAPLDGIDAKVASLVLACLGPEPTGRPKAREIAEALG